MKTKLVTILIMVSMLFAAFGAITPAAAAGSPSLTVTPVSGLAGSTVTISVNIDSQGALTRGYGIDLYFNPAQFTINSVTGASDATTLWVHALDGVNGVANPSCSDQTAQISYVHSRNTTTGHVSLAEAVLGCSSSATGAIGWAVKGTVATISLTILGSTANGVYPNTEFPGLTAKILDTSASPLAGTVINYNYVRVGAAPALAVQSIVFSPTSGSDSPTATVTIVNNGAAMSTGTNVDDTTVTLAMSGCTPATATALVHGLAAGATQVITQAYTACGSQSTLSVTDPVYGLNQSQLYVNAITNTQTTTVDASMPSVFINSATDGAINFGQLAYGVNYKYGSMTITSNAPSWTVQVAMDNWNLKEWNGSAYVTGPAPHPFSLQAPLQISVWNGTTQVGVTASSNVQLFAGTIAGQSPDAGQTFGTNFTQTLHHGDAVLASGFTYHGVVTFTDVAGF